MLNDRAATRACEEARYRVAGRPREGHDEVRAAARWRWVRRLASPRPGAAARLSLLDVGCGHGAFLRVAGDSGARVTGSEIDPTAAAACREAGLEVACGSVLDMPEGAGVHDLVTLWDVVDQLEDPSAALRVVATHLRPGGVLVVRGRNARLHVPSKRAALRLRRVVPTLPDPAVVHRWGLTPEGWRTLLGRTGLQDVRLIPPIPGRLYLLPSVVAVGRKRAAVTAGAEPPCSA